MQYSRAKLVFTWLGLALLASGIMASRAYGPGAAFFSLFLFFYVSLLGIGLSYALSRLVRGRYPGWHPTSIPVRQVVLSNAGSLAQRFNALYQQLMTQQQAVNSDIRSTASEITSLAENIAKLNTNIVGQSGVTGARDRLQP